MGIWLLAVNFLAYQKRLRECDQRVCVPQQQGHSLNVAHACSICLYELSKFNVMELVKESPHHHEAL